MLGGKDTGSDEEKANKSHKRSRNSKQSASMHLSVATSSSSSKKDLLRELPENFEPGEFDVVCSRGKWAMNSPGNIRYRSIIRENLQKYSTTTTKQEKSAIVSEIVDSIQALSPQGGFVRSVNGRWHIVTDHIAREKTGQSFRDLLHTQYRSSTKAKRRRQKEKDLKQTQPKPAISSHAQPRRPSNPVGSATSSGGTTSNPAFSTSSVASQGSSTA